MWLVFLEIFTFGYCHTDLSTPQVQFQHRMNFDSQAELESQDLSTAWSFLSDVTAWSLQEIQYFEVFMNLLFKRMLASTMGVTSVSVRHSWFFVLLAYVIMSDLIADRYLFIVLSSRRWLTLSSYISSIISLAKIIAGQATWWETALISFNRRLYTPSLVM